MEVQLATLKALMQIFAERNWPIVSENGDMSQEFEKLCEMVEALDDDQIGLIMNLLEDFTVVRYESYMSILGEVLSLLENLVGVHPR